MKRKLLIYWIILLSNHFLFSQQETKTPIDNSYFPLDSFVTYTEIKANGLNFKALKSTDLFYQFEILIDSSATRTLDSVIRDSTYFVKNDSTYQYDNSNIIWAKLKLVGKTKLDTNYTFLFSNEKTRINKLESWLVRKNGEIDYKLTGSSLAYSEKQIPTDAELINYKIGANEKVELYLRFNKQNENTENTQSLIQAKIIPHELFPGYFSNYPFVDHTNDLDNELPFQGELILSHEFVIDQNKNLTVNEVRNNWEKYTKLAPRGIKQKPKTTYWSKFKILGSPYLQGEQIFHVSGFNGYDSNSFDKIEYYIFNSNNFQESHILGDHVELWNRPYPFWANFIPLNIDESDSLEIFIKLSGADKRFLSRDLNIYHIDKTSLYPRQVYLGLKNGIFFGILALQIFFFAILLIIEKEMLHFFFILMVTSIFFTVGTDENNYFSFVILPWWRDIHIPLHYLSLFLGGVGLIKFTENYFEYKRTNFVLNYLIPIYIVVHFVLAILAINEAKFIYLNSVHGFGSPSFFHSIFLISQVLALVISLVLAYKASNDLSRSKKYYYAAFLPLIFIFGVFSIVNSTNLINADNIWVYDLLYDLSRISILIMSTLLALSIGFRTNKLKSEKEFAEKIAEKNEIIQAKSDQNELLLKEIHHRVKNNLQTISSLLYLQSFNIDDEKAKNTINISQQRVESMALIHKNLYQRNNLASIELKDYLQKLSENLASSYDPSQKVKILLQMEPIEVDVDTAIPIGLIANELVTNSFKYAFPNQALGEIHISFSHKEKYILKVADNGIGMHPESQKNFGTKLIRLLTKQLDGEIKSGNNSGFWTEIIF